MSQLIFDPETGLEAPQTAEIRESVAEDWKQAFFDPDLPSLNAEPTTPAGQLIDALTAEIEAKNAELLYLANQFNPRVADGRWQDALGYIYFLTRKIDEPTVVTCRLTGLYGTAVPYGALARSEDGYTLICNRSVTIGSDGTAETTFRCSETGSIEIAANSVTTIVTAIPGWDAINNEAAGATGRERETRSEFEARRYASVAANAHGSVSSLYGTLADLDGVLDVKVLENIGPDPAVRYGVKVPGHGVTVCVYGGEDADIAEAIHNKKDAGCDTGGNTAVSHTAADRSGAVYDYLIMRPETVGFWVRVTLGSGTGITDSIVRAVKEAVYADFLGQNEHSGNTRVGLASTVYASRFYCSVMEVEGVSNLLNVEIALADSPVDSDYSGMITINGDQMPVMSTDNVTTVIQD